MRIWWCQEHQMAQLSETNACDKGYEVAETDTCRMVPMRLIPDNAETVERIANEIAEWESAPYEGPNVGSYEILATLILAALDGETP